MEKKINGNPFYRLDLLLFEMARTSLINKKKSFSILFYADKVVNTEVVLQGQLHLLLIILKS